MFIENGVGSGGYKAEVTDHNMLRAYCMTETELSHQSEAHGLAYSWPAAHANLGGDVNVIWLRNDSTDMNLIIQLIHLGCSAVAAIELYMSTGTALNGAAVVGVNLNAASGKVALATCRTANTNVDAGLGSTLVGATTAPAGPFELDTRGAIVLGYLDEVSINIVTDIDLTGGAIVGYYH